MLRVCLHPDTLQCVPEDDVNDDEEDEEDDPNMRAEVFRLAGRVREVSGSELL